MPAALPGSTDTQNRANPSAGSAILFDPLSGPKNAPLDARTIASWSSGSPVYAGDPTNISTGALQTGIGFGSPPIFTGGAPGDGKQFPDGNFTDNYIPGQSKPDATNAANSTIMYIGGGRDQIVDGTGPNGNGWPAGSKVSLPNPYPVAQVAVCMAGNGGSRDGGASPFTGFATKTVTASGNVANGAVIETGWANRSGVGLTSGQSTFGSAAAQLPDVT